MTIIAGTTKVSSKGQVVIPENIRTALKLHAGDQLAVFANEDSVIVKTIMRPSKEAFKEMLAATRKWAKKKGITKRDLEEVIREVRRENKR